MDLSAYIHHTIGEGLQNLDRAIHWVKGRSPRVIVGMDDNGHNPWWGLATILTNPIGELIKNVIMELGLEIVNHFDWPPTFVSYIGHNTWIDLILDTRSRALLVLDWKVDTGFLIGSDHKAVFFSTSSKPLYLEAFCCKEWDQVDWDAFSVIASQ